MSKQIWEMPDAQGRRIKPDEPEVDAQECEEAPEPTPTPKRRGKAAAPVPADSEIPCALLDMPVTSDDRIKVVKALWKEGLKAAANPGRGPSNQKCWESILKTLDPGNFGGSGAAQASIDVYNEIQARLCRNGLSMLEGFFHYLEKQEVDVSKHYQDFMRSIIDDKSKTNTAAAQPTQTGDGNGDCTSS